MDEETVKLFILFQQYRDVFENMVKSKMFESPSSQWKVCFNKDKVLTDIWELDRVAFRR